MSLTRVQALTEIARLVPTNCKQKITADDIVEALMLVFDNSAGGGGGAGHFRKQLRNDPDDSSSTIDDIAVQYTMQHGKREIKVYDNVKFAWEYVYSEEGILQAIAAASLFQGIYKPRTNDPDLAALTDSGLVVPTGGDSINPSTGTAITPTATEIGVWINTAGHLPAFPLVLTAPYPVRVTYSDATSTKVNLPVQTYATEADFLTELATSLPQVSSLQADGTNWVFVTDEPLFVTSVYLDDGSGLKILPSPFTPITTGANNSVLNTYNWVVSTNEPSISEYIPLGVVGVQAGTELRNSDSLQFNAKLQKFEVIRGGTLTRAYADKNYWSLNRANMTWQDKDYSQGVVVLFDNIWWQSTRSISKGDPQPSVDARWRHINNSFGATTFFGSGDFDDSDTTAGNNWGMPTGTEPTGQIPSDGDVYYDVTSGTTVYFTATSQAPVFVIHGVVDPTTDLNLGQLSIGPVPGQTDINTFAVDGTQHGQNDFFRLITNGAFTPTGGTFAGVLFPSAATYLIVWTGDIDGDNEGWAIVEDNGSGALAWSLNTTTPQQQVKIYTVTTKYGDMRRFSVTIPVGTSANAVERIALLNNFLDGGANYTVTVKEVGAQGFLGKIEVSKVSGSGFLVSPIIVEKSSVHDDFGRLGIVVGGTDYVLTLETKEVLTADVTFEIVVESKISDLTSLVPMVRPMSVEFGEQSVIDASNNYPNVELNKFLQAMSGDAAAAVPGGNSLGMNLYGRTLAMLGGKRYSMSGYFVCVGAMQPLLAIELSDGTKLQTGNAKDFKMLVTTYDDNNVSVSTASTSQDVNFFPMTGHDDTMLLNHINPCSIVLDLRDPSYIIFETVSNYTTTDNKTHRCVVNAVYEVATMTAHPVDFYLSGYNWAEATWKMFNNA